VVSTDSSSVRTVGKRLDGSDDESCGGDGGKGEIHDDQDEEEEVAQQMKVSGKIKVVTSTEYKKECESELHKEE
jgi:hypothetical protein